MFDYIARKIAGIEKGTEKLIDRKMLIARNRKHTWLRLLIYTAICVGIGFGFGRII